MNRSHAPLETPPHPPPQVLYEDYECTLTREWQSQPDGAARSVLVVRPVARRPTPATLNRLSREFALADALNGAPIARPLELTKEGARLVMTLEDQGDEPVARLPVPMPLTVFLDAAVNATRAIGKFHAIGLIHKDISTANVLINRVNHAVRLRGFGNASFLPRERQPLWPPERIAGTLAFMAPEQTGRMNRSVDSRSDLYSLGVTLYWMLTGVLPFSAREPMDWVHSHVARKALPPSERVPTVPGVVSAIVMKLLSKAAEDRYQTAAGLERDLQRCIAQWNAKGRIDDFTPGENDTPDRLLIPEKLYGRTHEIASLTQAFDRVAAGRGPELVLLAGYSGIGKTAVVNELQKTLIAQRGLFAAGKFEQQNRDIPYRALAQAFAALLKPLLGKNEDELAAQRQLLRNALGASGALIANLVPELRLLLDDLPPVADLHPRDAQRRFRLAVTRFIEVFARADAPLVLFFDDLQWLDAATLDVLEDLLLQPDLRHLLLIGAYRDNETGTGHPLARKLDAIRRTAAVVRQIPLPPLSRADLCELVTDALRCTTEQSIRLASLVYDRSAGNPFYAQQFLSALVDEGLLRLDQATGNWSWDVERIRAKGYTDNVADLMIRKLTRLPDHTRVALQNLASVGHAVEAATLSLIFEQPEAQIHADLWDAACQELILRQDSQYRFAHDRVQEAVYSTIPQRQRAAMHVRIGRTLAARMAEEHVEDTVFEVVNQLNRGAELMHLQAERGQLAGLNLIAGRRAKAAAAYPSALAYLQQGIDLLRDDCWGAQHELAFALASNCAECEFLNGDLGAAQARLAELLRVAVNIEELAEATCLGIDLHVTRDRVDEAVATGLAFLGHLGIRWPPHPSARQVHDEYERIWTRLGGRAIEQLVELPAMSEPRWIAAMKVLIKLSPAAIFSDTKLFSIMHCAAVNLSIEHGNSACSPAMYITFGMIAGPHFGNYEAGFRFGQLGHELVEQQASTPSQAGSTAPLEAGISRALWPVGSLRAACGVMPWTKHVRAARELLRRAFETADRSGDITVASYSCNQMNTNLLAAGDPLDEVQREAERGLAYVQRAGFGRVVDLVSTQLALIRTLRGFTPVFGTLDDGHLSELDFERRVSGNRTLAITECWYWIRKMQARYLAGEFAVAAAAAPRAAQLLWSSPSFFETAEYHFYSALAHAACFDADADASPADAQPLLDTIMAHHRQLSTWALHCPDNFEDRAALVGAEIARLRKQTLEAEALYEQAIRAARNNGFVQNEAIAYETASRWYAARGFTEIAELYLRNARYAYLRWGASGKVRQLDDLHPQLCAPHPAGAAAMAIEAPLEHLDLATVLKVSQAVSGEIVPENLIFTIMRTAIAHAGAERGMLIMLSGQAPHIGALGTTSGDSISVSLEKKPLRADLLPESVVHYVMRTSECVILNGTSAQHDFSADPYLDSTQARSIVCMPLVNRAKTIAVLYLENSLAPDVFTASRVAVLKLLASQAAISLENSQLYRDLAEREAKIRRLVDANVVGVFIWELNGRILEANDEFLRIVGYQRAELASGQLRWTGLTPPEWEGDDLRAIAELRSTGSVQPYEKEYVRADGSRVTVLVGGALFGDEQDHGVAFIVDLTKRKEAEAIARDSEQRYREIEMELVHANRIETMGQLTASITHEIRQPIAASVTNAQAAMRWLLASKPDLGEIERALVRIINDGMRADDVINRIRALVKKAPVRMEPVALNQAILEVIALIRVEAVKHDVTVHAHLAPCLPEVHGDRVQLQQVVLNLLMNALEALICIEGRARAVTVTTRANDDARHVLVTLSDTGPGIDPENTGRLFEPFYTTKATGTGMGLSICESIVKAHGGSLRALANQPHGATFEVELPCVNEGGEHIVDMHERL